MRLIDADFFIEDIKTEIINLYLDGLKGTPRSNEELYQIIDRINEQPTVDAVPVVHGRWIFKENMIRSPYAKNAYCSECLEEISCCSRYCPNCGAKMDKKD